MRAATPVLTEIYVLIAAGWLIVIQILIVRILLIRFGHSRNQRVAVAAAVLLLAPIINAIL
jgi:hypothetical protein